MTEAPARATHPRKTDWDPDNPRTGWIRVTAQDEVAAPGEFPLVRSLIAGPFTRDRYNIAIDLFDKEPREYPPLHMGTRSAGINLNSSEVRTLRAALTAWLEGDRAGHY